MLSIRLIWGLGIFLLLACTSRPLAVDGVRRPAGFETLGESEVPASEVYSSGTLESLSASSDGSSPKQVESSEGPIEIVPLAKITNGPTTEQIVLKTGIRATRARAVKIADAVIDSLRTRRPGSEFSIQLELFPGEQTRIHLKVISGFNVNQGLHSGVTIGASDSKVQLSIESRLLSAFIDAGFAHYRIVTDPILKISYVIEVDESRP